MFIQDKTDTSQNKNFSSFFSVFRPFWSWWKGGPSLTDFGSSSTRDICSVHGGTDDVPSGKDDEDGPVSVNNLHERTNRDLRRPRCYGWDRSDKRYRLERKGRGWNKIRLIHKKLVKIKQNRLGIIKTKRTHLVESQKVFIKHVVKTDLSPHYVSLSLR